MDKEMLFRFMRAKFREAGFTPDEINLHIANLSQRYKDRTDEEIEGDIMRRGGPSQVVNRIIEQRNSVLMKDAEYRAFVEGQDTIDENDAEIAASAAETGTTAAETGATAAETGASIMETGTSGTETGAGDSAAESADDGDVRMYKPAAPKQGWTDTQNDDDDPLRAWFTDSVQDSREEDALPSMFRRSGEIVSSRETNASIEPNVSAKPESEEPSVSAVHTIPLFEEMPAQANEPRRNVNMPPRRENAVPTASQPTSQMPSRPIPDPEHDMSSTRVMHVATEETRTVPRDPLFAPQPVTDDRTRTVSRANIRQNRTTGVGTSVQANRGTPSASQMPQEPMQARPAHSAPARKQLPAFLRLPEITYWGEGSEEGVKRFRILFAVSLPFVILILLALVAVLLFISAAIAAAIIALVVALVVEVAVGSIIALVGIIYGISQLFLVLPVGMFELGLGIAMVGITMLAGILIYNLAVRFLPFVLRQLYRFAGFFRHYLQDLYYYVKGECYRR
ncbi:MAG: hypothetical protein IJ449_06170 [Clostridia bacterium]|nr:hypothetical protein [Clostridia bacterium]